MGGSRTERLWIAGAAVLALLVVVVGWFFLISPQRAETDDVESQTADAQTQNLTLQAHINQLEADSKNRSKYAAALAQARQALPTQSAMSLFIRNVQTIAAATSTRITVLNVGEPTAVTPAAGTQGASGTAPSAAPGATPAPAGGATAAPAAGAGTFSIPIDASVGGKPAALSAFLYRLQTAQPRAVLLTDVTRNADTGSSGGGHGNAVLQLKMSAFMTGTAAPATPTAPSASPGG